MNKTHILLLDVGNTKIKAALGSPRGVVAASLRAVPTHGDLAATLGPTLRKLFAQQELDMRDVAGCAVSSVVPRTNAPLVALVAGLTGHDPLFAPGQLPFGFANMAHIPDNVGADRLAGAYGAREAFPRADHIVIIDFGTATTVDCVRQRDYLGGLTCPGIHSAAESLTAGTAQLPTLTLTLDGPELELGFDTMKSLNQGFLFGFAGLAEGLVARLTPLLGAEPLVVATGGLAPAVATLCPRIDHVLPDLVMRGLLAASME